MPNTSDSAKHAFFYLVAFFALGFVATAIGQVIFQLINRAIVETTPSYSGDFTQSVLRFAVSALIIAAPIYYFATRKINIDLAKRSLDPDSAIRKWLSYVAIFIASAVAIGDLIVTLNSFLSGEITIKFILKSLTIFAIVGSFGSYYYLDLHRSNFTRDLRIRTFGIVFISVTVACLVTAFSLIDSPIRARELREDRERVQELQQISWAIADFYSQDSVIPQNLEMLVEDSKVREEVLLDPVLEEEYEFSVTGNTNYELCANFTHSSSDENSRDNFVDPSWEHETGRACFTIELSGGRNDYPIVEVKPVR